MLILARKALFLAVALFFISTASNVSEAKAPGSDLSPQFKKNLEYHWLHVLSEEDHHVRKDKNSTPEMDAYGAVDGRRYESYAGFQTQTEDRPWLLIDLEKPEKIGEIHVCNRPSGQSRAETLSIFFSTDGKKWEKVYQHSAGTKFGGGKVGETPLVVQCDGKKARYIRLQIENDFFHLNEVEVYAPGMPVKKANNLALKKFATQSSTFSKKSRSTTEQPVPVSPIKPVVMSFDPNWNKSKLPCHLLTPPQDPRERYAEFVSPELVERTFLIAERTVDYVENAGVALPEEKKLLAKMLAEWKKVSKPIEGEDVEKVNRPGVLPLKANPFVKNPSSQPEAAVQPIECSFSQEKLVDFYLRLRYLRREMIFKHPALDFKQILINKNPVTAYSHNGDQHLGRHGRQGEGLTILENWKGEITERPLLTGKNALPAGSTRNPDLHYDADKVAFAFCDQTREGEPRYFLYEAAIDGSWVRQITGTKDDPLVTSDNRATVLLEDNDPCYLPEGDLLFVSTRRQSYGRCHGSRYNPAWTLYRTTPDGKNVTPLSYNNENEYEPSVLNDGRVVFTRWEYTNRHEMWFHMLWWCRPDGTEVSNFYGADTLFPMMVVEATAIPGTNKVAAISQGHHSYNTGTVVVLDPQQGENGEAPVTHITPETPYSESPGVGWPKPHYSHPAPINEQMFLVSRANHTVYQQGASPPPGNDRAIYLVDSLGGREYLYEDYSVASVSPIPIRKREKPPVLPSRLTKGQDYGTLFVQNVYLTRNDPEGIIQPGMIKKIRVNEIGVQPRVSKPGVSPTVGNEIVKKTLGTVPVGPDGSAFFKVPAGVSLQMQILDENEMAILTEKSFFYLQPGENRSCVGCHEPTGTAPIADAIASMSRKQPVELTPPAHPPTPGGSDFHISVQPVLDRYCIRCHGLEETKKGVNFVADGSPKTPGLMAFAKRGKHQVGQKSYMQEMLQREYDANISTPRRYYAYSNKVAQMLVGNAELASQKGTAPKATEKDIKKKRKPSLLGTEAIDGKKFVAAHKKLKLDKNSYERIIEWLDLNVQYAGDNFRIRMVDRKLDNRGTREVVELATQLFGEKFASAPIGALINRVSPEQSRVLLAPLPVAEGGWGQTPKGYKGYKSKDDPNFKKMHELVEAAIIHPEGENIYGWKPNLETGAGEDWILKERRDYFKSLGRDFDSEYKKNSKEK